MKKHFLLIITLFMLCSCSTDNNMSTSASKTDADGTMQSSISASTEMSTTVQTTTSELPETVPQVFPEDEVLRAFVNAWREIPHDGMLLDLNLDGTPEYISGFGGEDTNILYDIYAYCNDSIVYMGSFEQAFDDERLTVKEITLYYDDLNMNYFYICESAVWDKMALDTFAETIKYEFINGTLTEEVIARCYYELPTTQDTINITSNTLLGENTTPIGKCKLDEFTVYYDGLSDYLNTLTKIKTIKVENMTKGEYDNIYDNLYDNYYNKNQS